MLYKSGKRFLVAMAIMGSISNVFSIEHQDLAGPSEVYAILRGNSVSNQLDLLNGAASSNDLETAKLFEAAMNSTFKSPYWATAFPKYCPPGYDGRGVGAYTVINGGKVLQEDMDGNTGTLWVGDTQIRCFKSASAPVFSYTKDSKHYDIEIKTAIGHSLPHEGLIITSMHPVNVKKQYLKYLNQSSFLNQMKIKYKSFCRGKIMKLSFTDARSGFVTSNLFQLGDKTLLADTGSLSADLNIECANINGIGYSPVIP